MYLVTWAVYASILTLLLKEYFLERSFFIVLEPQRSSLALRIFLACLAYFAIYAAFPFLQNFSWQAWVFVTATSLLGIATILDTLTSRIPLILIILIGVLGGGWRLLTSLSVDSTTYRGLIFLFLCLIFTSYLLKRIYKKRGMKKKVLGEGDLLLFLAAAFWLPWDSLPLFLSMAGGAGLLTGLAYQTRGEFPFVPAISFSFLVCLRFL